MVIHQLAQGMFDSILAASANHVTTVSMEELIFAN